MSVPLLIVITITPQQPTMAGRELAVHEFDGGCSINIGRLYWKAGVDWYVTYDIVIYEIID